MKACQSYGLEPVVSETSPGVSIQTFHAGASASTLAAGGAAAGAAPAAMACAMIARAIIARREGIGVLDE